VVVADPPGANVEISPFLIKGFAAESFAGWSARLFGPDAADTTIGGAEADPDGDGKANFLEYALRMDPHASGATPLLPPVAAAHYGKPALRFTIPMPAKNHLLRLTLQHSSDLQVWTDVCTFRTRTTGETYNSSAMSGVSVPGLVTGSTAEVNITSDSPLMAVRPGFWRLNAE
jgi:hypothetical protein